MKVLIAGASGALGTPLTRALIAAGHEVLGLARSPESIDRLTHLGAHPILANVMDRDDLLRAVKGVQADAVIHALTALKKTPLRHQDMYATNALRDVGTTNLLAAAREVGAHRFVAESMTLGYGYGDWGEKVITEDCPFAPPGFIWKMRQPPRSQPSNGARQEKRRTSSMTNRYTIKTSSRSSASRLTSRCPFHSQAG